MVRTDGNLAGAPRHLARSPFSSLQYLVLTLDQLSKSDKELVRAKVKALTTGEEAIASVGDGWQYWLMDEQGRVGVLVYKGVEVAVFYKRQTTIMERSTGDPTPESLVEPTDVWQRLDLLGPSARKANYFIKQSTEKRDEQIQLLEKEVQNQTNLADHYERLADRRLASIESLNKRVEKLCRRIWPDDKIIVRMSKYRYMTEKQAKEVRKKLALAAAKKAKRLAKMKAAEEAREKAEAKKTKKKKKS